MRKHAPAQRAAAAAVEPSSSIDPTALTATDADPSSITQSTVASDDVAKLAYSYWEARGYQGGTPEGDWLRAEQELKARAATAARA
jgi:hypothetical protein